MTIIFDAIVQLPIGGKLGRIAITDPDCRKDTIVAQMKSVRLGMDFPEFKVKAPLIDLNKAATWQMAYEMGVAHDIVMRTHTCYNGVHDAEHLHHWGFGCGECASCKTRKQGYEEWLKNYHYASYESYVRVTNNGVNDLLNVPWDAVKTTKIGADSSV